MSSHFDHFNALVQKGERARKSKSGDEIVKRLDEAMERRECKDVALSIYSKLVLGISDSETKQREVSDVLWGENSVCSVPV